MRKIEIDLILSIGFHGAEHRDTLTFEVEDDATDKEIEEMAQEYWLDWSSNYIDGGPRIVSITEIEE